MNRREFPGGLYVDALPSGEYVVLFPNSHLETHLGRVDFPVGESYGPMFLTCTNVPDFRFVGLAHDTVGTLLEWRQIGGWQRNTRDFKTGRVVYDFNGNILDTLPAGYQFLSDSGEPFSRIETYGPRNGLSEWSQTADLQIGQGHESGGVLVFDGQHLRVLDEGNCLFIREHRQGEPVAVPYVKSGVGAVIVQATLSELRALPIYATPEPEPEPEPNPMSYQPQAPDITPLLRDLTAQYPTEWAEAYEYEGHPRTDRFVRIAAKAAHARDPRFGLNGKRGTDTLSLDALAFKNSTVPAENGGVEIRDFIYDNGSPSDNPRHEITWNDVTLPNVAGKWIDPGGSEPPPPPPPPNGDDLTLAELSTAVALIQGRLDDQQDQINSISRDVFALNGLRQDIDELRAQIKELQNKPSGSDVTHGSPVEVTGSVGLGDVWANRKLTWTGKIK